MKRKYLAGRILAFALVLVLAFTAVPVSAFAQANVGETGDEGSNYDEETQIGEIEEVSEEGNGQEGVQPEIEDDSKKEDFTDEISSEKGDKEDGDEGKEIESSELTEQEETEPVEKEEESEPTEIEENEGFIDEEKTEEEVLRAASKDLYVDENNFPDEKFRNYLLSEYSDSLSYDAKGLYFTKKSVDDVVIINLNDKGVADLTGIENFKKLEKLIASGNSLESVNLSNNTNLNKVLPLSRTFLI